MSASMSGGFLIVYTLSKNERERGFRVKIIRTIYILGDKYC
jgi:hypothetical protein